VIQGYLLAMLSYPNDPTVVREFMTPAAAASWDPEAQIQVYEDLKMSVTLHSVHLKARLLGSLDERGSWTSTSGLAPQMDQQVVMRQVDGEWRIANPVEGTLINTAHFSLYYHQYSMYFYDPKYAVMAPDPVYLDTGAPGETATSLVRNLLHGPTANMAGVARSAAPAGTRLVSPVTVSSSGLATVALSGQVSTLDNFALTSLARQLAWTLRQERVGINHLTIRVNGRALPVPGRGSVVSVASFPDRTLTVGSRTLYALSGQGRMVRIAADGTTQAVSGPVTQPDIAARSIAIDPSNTSAALVAKDGTTVVWGALATGSTDSPQRRFRQHGVNLLRPSWDPFGLLWLVDMKGGLARLTVNNGDVSTPVPASSIEGLDVRSFAVSRDGMRLAAVIGRGTQSRLVMGMIERPTAQRKQTPVSVVGVRTIANVDYPLTNIRSLTWMNATTVAVLAADSSSESQPYQVSIDGSRIAPIPGTATALPVTIAAGPSSGAPLALGTTDGVNVRSPEQSWAPIGPRDLTAPAYPG